MRYRQITVVLALAGLSFGIAPGSAWAAWQEAGSSEKASNKDADKLTLEKIFPDRSMFGPSASAMAFSHDGRFAAYLYRPYNERRHGNDLYIYDTHTGVSHRVTSVSRLAEFQKDTREVAEHREEALKKAKHPRWRAHQEAQKEAETKANKEAGKDAEDKADETQTDAKSDAATQTESQPNTKPGVLGSWTGTVRTTSDAARLPASSPCTLTFTQERDIITGEFRSGLVRLPITNVKLDNDTLIGEINDQAAGVEGTLRGAIRDGAVEATVVLTRPAEIEFTIAATRAEGAGTTTEQRTTETTAESQAKAADTESKKPEKKQYATGVLNVSGHERNLSDIVLDKDAQDRRAPRYSGIQAFEWSPDADEMLVQADGDVYRFTIDAEAFSDDDDASTHPGEMERLTRTRERESSVAYLPDGSGYTYLRGGALLKVRFGQHEIVQLDPELGSGESMVGYRISPDMKRLVFLTQKGSSPFSGRRTVTLISYRDRFARARDVPRTMPDDPVPSSEASIYLYDLDGHQTEEGTLQKVFTRTVSGPRDVMYVPHWSPDSSRVAFAAFDQMTGQVSILEAGFNDTAPEANNAEENAGSDSDADTENQSDDSSDDGNTAQETAPDQPENGEPTEPTFTIDNARTVYRFYHNGGPNTPRMIIPQFLPDSRRLVFITELSGFRHLHILDPVYEELKQVTFGRHEVYPFDISQDHERLFFTANEGDPAQEHAFMLDLEQFEVTRLCSGEGVLSQVAVSDDGQRVLARKTDFGAPTELVSFHKGEDGQRVATVLTDSHPEDTLKLTAASPEYFSFTNRHGQTIHGHMFKPEDWSPEDKRPLLVYVYGGPLGERKMITRGAFSAPSYWFARYMAEEHGWVTATVDPRGASGFGAVFEKANFQRVGEPQTEDLVDAANWLVENAAVDESRMALHGWSFGGFQTQMVMYTEPKVFAAGIAGAGPTEWHNYNSWYTTGTIGPFEDFKKDLDQFSLLPLAKNLEGRLLLVHGVEDSNVLYQDTVRVYRELLQAGKEHLVDLFIDPIGGHGMGGDVKTIGRYRKYEDFLLTHVGKGEAQQKDQQQDEQAETAAASD